MLSASAARGVSGSSSGRSAAGSGSRSGRSQVVPGAKVGRVTSSSPAPPQPVGGPPQAGQEAPQVADAEDAFDVAAHNAQVAADVDAFHDQRGALDG